MGDRLTVCSCRGNNERCSFCFGTGYLASDDEVERQAPVRLTAEQQAARKAAIAAGKSRGRRRKTTAAATKVKTTVAATKVSKSGRNYRHKQSRLSDRLIEMTKGTVRERKAKTLLKLLHMMSVDGNLKAYGGAKARRLHLDREVHRSLTNHFTQAIEMEQSKFLAVFDNVMTAVFSKELKNTEKTSPLNDALKNADVDLRFTNDEIVSLCRTYDRTQLDKTSPNTAPGPADKSRQSSSERGGGNILDDTSSRAGQTVDARHVSQPAAPVHYDALISVEGPLSADDFDIIRTRINSRNFRYVYATGSSNTYRKLQAEFPNSSIILVSQEANARSLRASSTVKVISVGSPTVAAPSVES